ncbi:hypothetical protein [Sphingopyxis sp. L1A2A]|uniref:hypothetical protein n=1 Tax=Sphingopyxis sp. L1A2A TaxID=2502247 RepID=UPI0020167B48|nr:hypothetical protein [Sphingopyxis sp. L1A2A]
MGVVEGDLVRQILFARPLDLGLDRRLRRNFDARGARVKRRGQKRRDQAERDAAKNGTQNPRLVIEQRDKGALEHMHVEKSALIGRFTRVHIGKSRIYRRTPGFYTVHLFCCPS